MPFRRRQFQMRFSWMKIFELWLKFHWSLFPRVQLTISQQRIYASLGLNELNVKHTLVGHNFFMWSHSLWVKFVKFSYLATLFWVIFVKTWFSNWGKNSPHVYSGWGENSPPGLLPVLGQSAPPSSYPPHNGISYSGKMTSLYWFRPWVWLSSYIP